MKTNNSTDTKDILDECQETLKAHVIPEQPDYGNQNIGYDFCNKHGSKASVILFTLMLIGLFVFAIVSLEANLNLGKPRPIDMQVTTTVIHHNDGQKTDPSVFSKFLNKKIEGDPQIIAAFDSIMKEKQEASLAAQEERRQHIRDSLARFIYRRDSIRAELVRQDSIRLELEKKRQARIDYFAVIDDGITKRTVNVNSVVDTLTEQVTTELGNAFTTMSIETVKERQKEIDRTKDYYKRLRIKTEQLL
jgi:hypothetical protein